MSKTFSKVLTAAVCAAAIFLTLPARAQVAINLLAIGDTNNAADTTVMVTDTTTGYGSVSYNYSISADDVTVAQYAACLNAVAKTDPYGMWNPSMASDAHVAGIARSGAYTQYTYSVIGSGSNPITYVSWLDAARFCNWLENGQPSTGVEGASTTESGANGVGGAYTLDGDTSSGMETKNTGALWWIPEENEWYKAAYYDPTIGGTGGYWTFPTMSNTAPGNDFLAASGSNQANYIANGLYSVTQSATEVPSQDYLTPVGAFTSSTSALGTYDQGGDVYQWNDAIIGSSSRGVRGGAWDQTSNTLQSNDRENRSPTAIYPDVGFRVATSMAPIPVINSSLTATGTDDVNFTYTITATNNPTSYNASGLPAGLSTVSASGVISGTPTQSGTFQVTLGARNGSGTVGNATLVLVILPLPLPTISSSLTATGTDDLPFSYTITADFNASSFGATGLPSGLVVTASSGLISGTPTQTGTFSPTITAVNASGTGSATLALDILNPPPPVISSTLSVTGTAGTPFDYQIVASYLPTTYTSGTLPSGLSLDGSTGLISGTPTESGSFSPTIAAINLGGTDTETLALTLLPPVPNITGVLTATATNGMPFSYQIAAGNGPLSFGATGLPPGLVVTSTGANAGLISGTIAGGGVYAVTLDAVNDSGTGTAVLKITVETNLNTLGGSYEGLVSVAGTNQGLFTLSLTSAGAFTGKVTLPATSYSLKGTFSPQGVFNAIQAVNTAILDVFLNVNAALPGVSGTVIAATPAGTITTYGLQSGLLRTYTAKTIPTGLTGYYTAMLPAVTGTVPTLPDAPGYGVMNVTNTGAIHIDGKLGDGSSFNVRSQLHADGKTWTFYTPLYGGSTPGSLAGTMTFENLTGSDSDGTLDWIKNAGNTGFYSGGFGVPTGLVAAKYPAPPPVLSTGTSTGTLVLAGGNLAMSGSPAITGTTYTLTISTADKVKVTSGSTTVTNTAVNITPSTGVFSGKFPFNGTGSEVPFGGVFYAKPAADVEGFGLFLGSSETGSVTITR